MGFFSKIFNKKSSGSGELNHPKDLQLGDSIKLGYVTPAGISRKSFKVTSINTYDFEQDKSTSFTLQGTGGDTIWLSVNDEGGEESLSVSRKLTRGQVFELFGESEFGEVFEEGRVQSLLRKAEPEGLEGWTAQEYREIEDCSNGYYHKGDYRDRDLPKYEDESDAFEYYLLEDDEEDYAIECEVYPDGETEVMATAYLPISSVYRMTRKVT